MEYQTITINKPKWVRSPEGICAGVCEGLGKSFGVDPWFIRLIWLLTILAFGTGLLAYIILAICLPREDRIGQAYNKRILGVCSRVAQRLDMEVGVVRFFTVILGFMSLGVTIVGYLVLHFVLEQQSHSQWTQKRIYP